MKFSYRMRGRQKDSCKEVTGLGSNSSDSQNHSCSSVPEKGASFTHSIGDTEPARCCASQSVCAVPFLWCCFTIACQDFCRISMNKISLPVHTRAETEIFHTSTTLKNRAKVTVVNSAECRITKGFGLTLRNAKETEPTDI